MGGEGLPQGQGGRGKDLVREAFLLVAEEVVGKKREKNGGGEGEGQDERIKKAQKGYRGSLASCIVCLQEKWRKGQRNLE